MSLARIRKGDEVIVITGRDKGRRGSVLRVLDDERLVVEGINVAKKHQKPNPNAGVEGGIIDKEMPIHVSNVMLFNPQTSLAYEICAPDHVVLAVHDVSGRLVRTLVDGVRPAGRHTVTWDGRNDAGQRVASGVYLATFRGAGEVQTRKMTVVK